MPGSLPQQFDAYIRDELRTKVLDLVDNTPMGGPPRWLHGKQVFARSGCITCHSAGTESKLGPPLAGIGNTQDASSLLESILG